MDISIFHPIFTRFSLSDDMFEILVMIKHLNLNFYLQNCLFIFITLVKIKRKSLKRLIRYIKIIKLKLILYVLVIVINSLRPFVS